MNDLSVLCSDGRGPDDGVVGSEQDLLDGEEQGISTCSSLETGHVELSEMGRDHGEYMDLHSEPVSKEAVSFVEALALELWASRRRWQKPTPAFEVALGAVIADLLKPAGAGAGFLYRKVGSAEFTGMRVGYYSFIAVIEALIAKGHVEKFKGVHASASDDGQGRATRFRAFPSLLLLAEQHGIPPTDWGAHFQRLPRPSSVKDPLVLKSSTSLVKGKKVGGIPIPIDYSDPRAERLAKQVNEINAFFSTQHIDPDKHFAFRRVFNQGDRPGFDWNKGGRLISVNNSYQQMKAVERQNIKLNGEPTVEIDIRASHLTILHAKLGLPLSSDEDPYQIPGIPRDIVKGWVTMTLGYDRFQTRWSRENRDRYFNSTGRVLQKDYPIKKVRERILKFIPALESWNTCSIRWGDLQYIESQIVIQTVYDLACVYGTPALPVHDSLIVAVNYTEIAKKVMADNFRKNCGAVPVFSIKGRSSMLSRKIGSTNV
jgi:hypothetical protein